MSVIIHGHKKKTQKKALSQEAGTDNGAAVKEPVKLRAAVGETATKSNEVQECSTQVRCRPSSGMIEVSLLMCFRRLLLASPLYRSQIWSTMVQNNPSRIIVAQRLALITKLLLKGQQNGEPWIQMKDEISVFGYVLVA